MYYFWFWQTSNSISRARTRVIVCPAVHTARRCVFYVCFFFYSDMERHFHTHILPSKNKAVTSNGGYFSWSATVGPLLPQNALDNCSTPDSKQGGKKFPCKQVDPGRTSDRLDGISPSDLMGTSLFLARAVLIRRGEPRVKSALEVTFHVRTEGRFLMFVARRFTRRRWMSRRAEPSLGLLP